MMELPNKLQCKWNDKATSIDSYLVHCKHFICKCESATGGSFAAFILQ